MKSLIFHPPCLFSFFLKFNAYTIRYLPRLSQYLLIGTKIMVHSQVDLELRSECFTLDNYPITQSNRSQCCRNVFGMGGGYFVSQLYFKMILYCTLVYL